MNLRLVKHWLVEMEASTGNAPVQVQEAAGTLAQALALAETLHPRIASGFRGKLDAAKDIEALRDERMRAPPARSCWMPCR